jgi:hypothetical protein
MLIQNQVGPVATTTSISAGLQAPARAGQLGDMIVSELHGRYYETTYRRNGFIAANPTGVTTVAFTSGTTVTGVTGTILYNPIGSLINCVVNKVGFAFPVINTTVNTVILAAGYNNTTAPSSTTALTVRSNFVGVGTAGTGLVYSVATLPTAPNTIAQLASMPSATTLPSVSFVDLEGSIILPAGAYLCLITTAASPTSGFQGSISWEEVPI